MNPILPLSYAAPDGEAHVWRDDPNTLYLYASNDRIGGGNMDPWQYVWSTRDLVHWEKHPGLDARVAVGFEKVSSLPASDAIQRNGKYYYYFTAGGCQCVAFSDCPGGPFLHAKRIPGTEWASCGDPSVFVDDDNTPYLFWGQFKLHGCKLKDNMSELDEAFHKKELLTEERDGFHEGSSIRKRGNWYYMVYTDISRGSATCLSYAKARHPLGPYKKGGIIIDNLQCDIASWNNHGCITCFQNQWYVVYHRACHGLEMGGRKACMEPIYFDENGDIAEVKMTTQGVESPISAFQEMEAWRVCEYSRPDRRSFSMDRMSMEERERFLQYWPIHSPWFQISQENRIKNERSMGLRTAHVIIGGEHKEYLTRWEPGESALYRYLDFGSGAKEFICQAAAYIGNTSLEVHIDGPDGPIIGVCPVKDTGGYGFPNFREFRCPVLPVQGVHELAITGQSGEVGGRRLCDLLSFRFE